MKVAVSGRGSQPVGLMKKPGRSTLISMFRTCSGTPPRIDGMSVVIVSMPVSDARSVTLFSTTTLPRSIGPAFAGTTSASVAASPWTFGSAR